MELHAGRAGESAARAAALAVRDEPTFASRVRRYRILRGQMAKRTAAARIHIQYPQPVVDAGRYPAKRTVGDLVEVSCDVFRDGHEKLRAVARPPAAPGTRKWAEAELHPLDAHHNGVRWGGSFVVDKQGRWEFTIQAWTDVFATWRDELRAQARGRPAPARERAERGRRAAARRSRRAPRAPTAS